MGSIYINPSIYASNVVTSGVSVQWPPVSLTTGGTPTLASGNVAGTPPNGAPVYNVTLTAGQAGSYGSGLYIIKASQSYGGVGGYPAYGCFDLQVGSNPWQNNTWLPNVNVYTGSGGAYSGLSGYALNSVNGRLGITDTT